MLRQGYRALNDTGTLGAVFRARLQDYRDVIGETGNPLQNPRTHKKLYNTTWFARVAHILHTNNHKITTTTDITRRGGRALDVPVSEAMKPDTHKSLLPDLIRNNLYWVGDVADNTGKTIRQAQRGMQPYWWKELRRALTLTNSSTLVHQVSPASDHIFQPTKHKIGDVVFLPRENIDGSFADVAKGHFYKVTGHATDEEGRPSCILHLLTPLPQTPKCTAPHLEETFHRVLTTSALWADPKSHPEIEVQADLLNVQYTCHRTATFTSRHSQ